MNNPFSGMLTKDHKKEIIKEKKESKSVEKWSNLRV